MTTAVSFIIAGLLLVPIIWVAIKDRCKQTHQKGGIRMSCSSLGKKPEDYINLYDQLKNELMSDRYRELKQAKALGDARKELMIQQDNLRKQEVALRLNNELEQPLKQALANPKHVQITLKLDREFATEIKKYYTLIYNYRYVDTSGLPRRTSIDPTILSEDYVPFVSWLAFESNGNTNLLRVSIKRD